MIRLENVSVDFPAGKTAQSRAVNNVNLTIQQGEVFGIVGTSGAGKSTLLRTINLLQRPTEGRVFLGDTLISNASGRELRQYRQRIGMIFQHFNLMHTRNVYDNVAFSLRAAGKSKADIAERVPEILALVGLQDKGTAYPAQLSGGQKQRVGIARAIANHPEVLLCDEPTSALDLETSASILALLKSINVRLGITIVLISHEMSVIKSICQRMAVMTGGNIVEEGEVFTIFSAPQHAYTKQLVSHTTPVELPDRFKKNNKGVLLKILFADDSVEQPILSDVAQQFQVSVNILHGNIEYINDRALGHIIAQISYRDDPAAENLAAAIAYIRQNTFGVEVIND
ncbi:methionine ABC transporter ATP-binding protein [Pectobacterium parmentieri]|uniref:methionine ABC transporter ATP-binding protein n=1 Tax=Pectobacterium parmentieri TaxID=1905730 RepID=UPI000EB4EE5E|nr:methionine ABC transporter ATP-binding protein [Pectobacterium parmentieri]AYH01722.1 methionine ABC transporter ATP-binding protein [Pectobacterium parmentieri]AYH27989.1 methionine ABC transporter ATP-binding protein [Pectobacterium parmentieri]AYH32295.1 methionine ABC transporter ATP-binding protein [Pectobacterium parmentieri]MBI0516930.1 methionine ABC transporter ATP-binding protein [Pectobacterium parmentieri]